MCVIRPNFIKIGQTAAKTWRFNGFQNGGRLPSWICEIRIFLRPERFRDPFYRRTKFCKDRSNHSGDIVIFVIFKVAAVAMLNFQKFKILTVDPL